MLHTLLRGGSYPCGVAPLALAVYEPRGHAGWAAAACWPSTVYQSESESASTSDSEPKSLPPKSSVSWRASEMPPPPPEEAAPWLAWSDCCSCAIRCSVCAFACCAPSMREAVVCCAAFLVGFFLRQALTKRCSSHSVLRSRALMSTSISSVPLPSEGVLFRMMATTPGSLSLLSFWMAAVSRAFSSCVMSCDRSIGGVAPLGRLLPAAGSAPAGSAAAVGGAAGEGSTMHCRCISSSCFISAICRCRSCIFMLRACSRRALRWSSFRRAAASAASTSCGMVAIFSSKTSSSFSAIRASSDSRPLYWRQFAHTRSTSVFT
mmetsp:Transcript_14834/g.43895  ORF Transcript_14834/g.43895 Transcript_14834/m.43895 type:complete len:320 (-) Transcript_14834:465-1424(-)